MSFLCALLLVIVSIWVVARLLGFAYFVSRKELVEEFKQTHYPKRKRLLYDHKQGYYVVYR